MTPDEAYEAMIKAFGNIKTHEDFLEYERLRKLAGPMRRPEKDLPADAEEKVLEIYKDRPMD